MPKKLIPPEDYQDSEPKWLKDGALVYWHVDGSEWRLFYKGHRTGGWFTSPFDRYYVDEENFTRETSDASTS
jgi:hypothetical protein